MNPATSADEEGDRQVLLSAFRFYYHQFHEVIQQVSRVETDSFRLEKLGEELEEFSRLVERVCDQFGFF